MKLPATAPTIELSTSSGVVRVIVHPAKSWLVFLIEMAVFAALATTTYEYWRRIWYPIRGLLLLALAATAVRFVFRFWMTESIEIDERKITIRKDVHGWERTREFEVKDCRELEWTGGSEDEPQRLQFKNGWRTIAFGEGLTEDQSIQILTALQQTLPAVAQKLCSYPDRHK